MNYAIFLLCLVICGTTTTRHMIKRHDKKQNLEVKPTSDVEKMVLERLEMLETLLGDLYAGEGLLEELWGNAFLVNKDTIKNKPDADKIDQ